MEEDKMTPYELRSINNSELMQNENYLKYLEDLPRLERIRGVFIAYQNQKIVYTGSVKIQNGLDLAIEKVSQLTCKDIVFIVKVGE